MPAALRFANADQRDRSLLALPKNAASVVVRNMGVLSDPVPVSVSVAAPACSANRRRGRVRRDPQSGSGVNTPTNPAAKGSIITLFGTGEGQTNHPVSMAGHLAKPAAAAVIAGLVTIAGIPAPDISYAGAAPTFTAGALQINVRIPDGGSIGPVPVVLYVGNSVSQGN